MTCSRVYRARTQVLRKSEPNARQLGLVSGASQHTASRMFPTCDADPGPLRGVAVSDQGCTANLLHHIRDTHQDTRFTRPQVLSADQMLRSSRNRSIGAADLIDLIR